MFFSHFIDEALKSELEEIELLHEEYPGQKDQARRDKIVELVVDLADRVIMEGSSGETEETDYLTARVASRFVEKVQGRAWAQLARADLERRGH